VVQTELKLELDSKDNVISLEIDEQKIIDITRKLVFAENSELEEKDLLYETIRITKCDLAWQSQPLRDSKN